jgi:hypothetical protein
MVWVSTTQMPDDPDAHGADAPTAVPTASDGSVEAYQTEEGIVLYDAGNPLAWIESQAPVRLDDAA